MLNNTNVFADIYNKKQTITVLSPAKLNTFLHIHQQRKDGFHELVTYFQLIDLCDEITFTINDTGVITVDNPIIAIDEQKDLCYRAAKLLQQQTNKTLGVNIKVKKNIPNGAGLGGGSSNAATVLVVLNQLWEIHLTTDELLKFGLELGSDVPVFIYGKSTLATGRGEKFITLDFKNPLKNKQVIIIKPNIHVSTAKIFQSELLTKRNDEGKIRHLDIASLIYKGENDFTDVVFRLYPEISQVAKRLSVYGTAHLTGTGACIYTVLDDVKKADKIADTLNSDDKVFVVSTLDKSPLYKVK